MKYNVKLKLTRRVRRMLGMAATGTNMNGIIIMVPVLVVQKDFIPHAEAKFDAWQKNFVAKVAANQVLWVLPPADVTALQTFQTSDWDPKYLVGKDEADPKPSQRAAKKVSHATFDHMIREFIQKNIRRNNNIPEDGLIALGVPPIDDTHTDASLPTDAPTGRIEKFTHLKHLLRITHNTEELQSNGLPKGIKCVRVYRAITEKDGTPPADYTGYGLLANATTHLVDSHFTEAEEGKRAHYVLLYENTTGKLSDPSIRFNGLIP